MGRGVLGYEQAGMPVTGLTDEEKQRTSNEEPASAGHNEYGHNPGWGEV